MKVLTCVILLSTLCGCTTFSTTPVQASPEPGLLYFLPKRDIVVTVEVKNKLPTKIIIGRSDPYPDTRQAYVLRHKHGMFGKHETDIAVKNGLLTSSKSVLVSEVSNIAKSLAATAGAVTASSPLDDSTSRAECADGSHTVQFAVDAPQLPTLCGAAFSITPLYRDTHLAATALPGQTTDPSPAGIYYRTNLPYRVTAVFSGAVTASEAAIVHSPSQSPTFFLPIARGFFADTSATFSFEDYTITNYKQVTSSEAVAALKLPADVIGAYFGAMGELFGAFKKRDSDQTALYAEMLKLEIAKQKYEACRAALASEDKELLKTLGCG